MGMRRVRAGAWLSPDSSQNLITFFFHNTQGENFGLPPVPTPAVLTVDDAWDGARHEVAVEAAAEAAAPTTAPAAAELSAALAAAGEAVATFGPASREALAADARVAAAEATLRSGSG